MATGSLSVPLETLVERERVRREDEVNFRLVAEAGLHFLRLLSAHGVGIYRNEYLLRYRLDPALLHLLELIDPASLAAKLRTPTDSVSLFLRQQLSSKTSQLLAAYGGGAPSRALQQALVDDLNRLLRSPSLYDPQRFAQVSLTEEAQRLVNLLLQRKLPDTALSYLNRLLLELAYPQALANSRARDNDSLRFLDVVAHRVPDGRRLYADLSAALRPPTGPGDLPAEPRIPPPHREKAIAAARAWLRWYEELFSEPGNDESPWVAERMEYSFAVSGAVSEGNGAREIALVAPEYVEGHLDWYSFVARPTTTPAATNGATPVSRRVIPAPVSYRGMPASRWWAFEDNQVDFGAVEAAPEDLARLLFMEFALVYGNDWFVMPLEVAVGSLCRIQSLVVTDSFGEQTSIQPFSEVDGPESPWRMFHLSPDRRTDANNGAEMPDIFFLPPVLAASLHSPPVEEVLLLRDEMANMAWAVERMVENGLGQPLNRFEAFQAERRRREREAPSSEPTIPPVAPIAYRLASTVPDYWIPLLPVPIGPASIALKRAAMPGIGPDGSPQAVEPRGRILQPNEELTLYEEEVPRAGARVTRAYQYTRWTDGSTHLWIGRRKQPGRGEGSSGLRFDIVEPV